MTSVAISAFYTALGAIWIALFQLTIKGIARLKNLQHGGGFKSLFKEDDFAFWHEWILAALVAMTIKVVGDSGDGQATAQTIIITFLLQIVFWPDRSACRGGIHSLGRAWRAEESPRDRGGESNGANLFDCERGSGSSDLWLTGNHDTSLQPGFGAPLLQLFLCLQLLLERLLAYSAGREAHLCLLPFSRAVARSRDRSD